MGVIPVLVKEFGCCPRTQGELGRTPLHQACIGGHVDVVRKLKVECGADVSVRDSQDNTPLNLAAIFRKTNVICVVQTLKGSWAEHLFTRLVLVGT